MQKNKMLLVVAFPTDQTAPILTVPEKRVPLPRIVKAPEQKKANSLSSPKAKSGKLEL
mgnify:CR=1